MMEATLEVEAEGKVEGETGKDAFVARILQ